MQTSVQKMTIHKSYETLEIQTDFSLLYGYYILAVILYCDLASLHASFGSLAKVPLQQRTSQSGAIQANKLCKCPLFCGNNRDPHVLWKSACLPSVCLLASKHASFIRPTSALDRKQTQMQCFQPVQETKTAIRHAYSGESPSKYSGIASEKTCKRLH